jgi:DNA-directed RNA polymerase specialized sigma subunit
MAALQPLNRVHPKPKVKKDNGDKKKKSKGKTSSYLERLISTTEKFRVEDLLNLYGVYEHVVIDEVFRLLLFPYVRMSRVWLRDQARDMLAETDRNRLILTSRARKSGEADFETMIADRKSAWSKIVKEKHANFIVRALRMLHTFDVKGQAPSLESIRALGMSRLVYDDMGTYYNALMNRYPELVADWCSAKADGDIEELLDIEAQIKSLETEVGVLRDYAWYVTVNVRGYYDLVEKMIHRVTMAYTRLLFRFSHQLRGVTSTEENFSAGYEGLIRAARNYDPIDGSSFTAHCQWWVRSAVLQRQRQSSIISLPSTTWYQLSLLQKGQVELSTERVSDLKERAEMFYANSANASRAMHDVDDQDDYSFESVKVTSPDAGVVLGSALTRSQATEENYESQNLTLVGHKVLDDVMSLLHQEDPSLIFPVLLWALNSGIDATLLADVSAPLFLSEKQAQEEGNRHNALISRLKQQTRPLVGTQGNKDGKVERRSKEPRKQWSLGPELQR